MEELDLITCHDYYSDATNAIKQKTNLCHELGTLQSFFTTKHPEKWSDSNLMQTINKILSAFENLNILFNGPNLKERAPAKQWLEHNGTNTTFGKEMKDLKSLYLNHQTEKLTSGAMHDLIKTLTRGNHPIRDLLANGIDWDDL